MPQRGYWQLKLSDNDQGDLWFVPLGIAGCLNVISHIASKFCSPDRLLLLGTCLFGDNFLKWDQ